MSLDASLKLAEASVKQAEANLSNSQANLDYTEIVSPVDGIVIDRKIEPGQTLAASFQTPELFVIAPDMEKKMYIFASVDEADIGLIRKADEGEKPVRFTVDAYPDDLFEGSIEQIRYSATANQNVVTYPVVVVAPNPDLKLLPWMTANLSFEVEKREDCVLIPNAALRFYPNREHVRAEDLKILDGSDERDDDNDDVQSATQQFKAASQRNRRHVWVQDGAKLRAIEVVTESAITSRPSISRASLKSE